MLKLDRISLFAASGSRIATVVHRETRFRENGAGERERERERQELDPWDGTKGGRGRREEDGGMVDELTVVDRIPLNRVGWTRGASVFFFIFFFLLIDWQTKIVVHRGDEGNFL